MNPTRAAQEYTYGEGTIDIVTDQLSRRDRKGKKREQIAFGHGLGTMESCVVGPDFPPVSQCFESFPWDRELL